MDICACLSIEKIAKSSCVTASMDHLVFSSDKSFRDGDVMVVEAQVVRCFNTSAEVVVRVMSVPSLSPHFSQSLEKEQCFAHAFFIFVRLDRGPMPGVFPQTAVERQEHELSMERRQSRQSKKKLLSSARASISIPNPSPDAESVSDNQSGRNPHSTLAGVPADRSLLEYTHIVLPTHANHMGNTFGGQIMCWAEEVAVLAATVHVNTALIQQGKLFMLDPDPVSEEQEQAPVRGARGHPPLVPVPTESELSFSTAFVSTLSFLSPSTVGDRVHVRAQCCRAFGSVIEVEVVISASDVEQRSVREINTGHFCICCRESAGRADVVVPPVLATTVEQRERLALSLQRMLIASTRSAGSQSAVEVPLSRRDLSARSGFPQLASMLRTGGVSGTVTGVGLGAGGSNAPQLSPEIEAECSAELALHDICGLLCALSHTNTSALGEWETLPQREPGAILQVRVAGEITKLLLKVTISAPVTAVAELILDLDRRGEWDAIMAGRVVRQIAPAMELVWMGTVSGRARVDYSLLRCHRTLEDGRVAIVSRSVLHPALPPVVEKGLGEECAPAYVRCEVLPSGFLLTPTETECAQDGGPLPVSECTETHGQTPSGGEGNLCTGSTTQMQYLLQFDARSAKNFAGELDGRSSQIMASMLRLKSILERDIMS